MNKNFCFPGFQSKLSFCSLNIHLISLSFCGAYKDKFKMRQLKNILITAQMDAAKEKVEKKRARGFQAKMCTEAGGLLLLLLHLRCTLCHPQSWRESTTPRTALDSWRIKNHTEHKFTPHDTLEWWTRSLSLSAFHYFLGRIFHYRRAAGAANE